MRNIALFSDIHGDLEALEKVLADIESRVIDEAYCLGDLAGYGAHSTEVLKRLRKAGVPTIRGNCDRSIELPLQLRFEHLGIRILLTHGSPRRINEYLTPDIRPELLLQLAEDAGADVICVGHVHIPYHLRLTRPHGGTVHFICDGSVGRPRDRDPRVAWVELILGDHGEVDSVIHRI